MSCSQTSNAELGTWAIFLLLVHFRLTCDVSRSRATKHRWHDGVIPMVDVLKLGEPQASLQPWTKPALTTPGTKPPSKVWALIDTEGFWGRIGMASLQAHGTSPHSLELHPSTPQLWGMLWVGSTWRWWLYNIWQKIWPETLCFPFFMFSRHCYCSQTIHSSPETL